MGMNTILMLIAGIVMSTMIASQVAPSIVEGVKVKKVQTQTINNQEVIFEAIKRYVTIKQVAPTTMAQLISAGYIDAKVNNNGFGVEHIIDSEKYTFSVSTTTGVATITTTIVDPKAQEAFLNSFMGTSKPTRVGTTNNFETKFVLPNEVMHGNALLMTGIPIQAKEPDSNTNKYWYDTRSGKAILKVYDKDNSSWIEVNLGGEANTQKFEPGDYDLVAIDEASFNPGYSSGISKKLEYIVTRSGTLRVSFSISRNGFGYSYARIYVNDVAKGTIVPVTYGSKQNFSEDINVEHGDKLQLYIYHSNSGSAYTTYVSSFRIMSSKETMFPLIKIF